LRVIPSLDINSIIYLNYFGHYLRKGVHIPPGNGPFYLI
jgi:hypothetical protein